MTTEHHRDFGKNVRSFALTYWQSNLWLEMRTKTNMKLPQPDYLTSGISGVLAPSLEKSGSGYSEAWQKVL